MPTYALFVERAWRFVHVVQPTDMDPVLAPPCEFCGGPLYIVLFFAGKPWLRCEDCGHDQASNA